MELTQSSLPPSTAAVLSSEHFSVERTKNVLLDVPCPIIGA